MRVASAFLTVAALFPLVGMAQLPGARGIAARANQSVVAISATLSTGERRTGTGFFVKANGTFVTNYHVIEGASALSVELATGEVFRTVYFLGADSDHDLAALRVPVAAPGVLDLGSDATLEVGDRVYTMSNPLGLDRTFSEGILSSKRLERGVQLLQITAPISRGSSGGPVMDASGKVIGVATLVTRQGQALNWAVPVRYVVPLLELAGAPRAFSAAMVPHRPGLGDPDAATPIPTAGAGTASGLGQAMRAKIVRFVDGLAAQGYPMKLTHEMRTGVLRVRETTIIPLQLDQGVYTVFGLCDSDCGDLDLAVRELDGTVAGEDIKADNVPVVTLTVRRSGAFRIVVTMAGCTVEPCWYGVAVGTAP